MTLAASRPVFTARRQTLGVAAGGRRRRSVVRRAIAIRLRSERTVPVIVALVVLLAGVVSLGPGAVQPVGASQGDPQPVRLAIGGGVPAQLDPGVLQDLSTAPPLAADVSLDDGTLYKPVAVDTTIETSSDLLQHYTVRAGDTLSEIAGKFNVSLMTIWWANHLKSTDQLHIGQTLVIPPVDGLVVTVQAADTLDSLATKYKVSTNAIVEANSLTDTNLIIGQVLLMPGAKGAAIPKRHNPVASTTYSGTFHPTSGPWRWPVAGNGWYISQYFSSYHPAIDIAAPTGTPELAARAGVIIAAGTTTNGCGISLQMSIGDGLYLAYCHMSAIHVTAGEVVARGQQVGNIGQTGWATGPHLHFEVWVGRPWKSGSYRVNPLRYF